MEDKTREGQKLPRVISRRNFMRGVALGGLGVAAGGILSACGVSSQGGAASTSSAGSLPSHPKWHFVFVNHVTTNPFFVPTQYGIQDVCNLLGCSFEWTGSSNSQVSDMVNAIDTAVAGKADGIATCIIDPAAFNKPIADALAAGIPVVAYNADAPASSHNQRMAYIGQDLFTSGQMMGQRILKLVPPGSHVGLFIATPGTLNIQPRIDGAVAAIKQAGNPITYDVVATGALVEQELSRIDSYYLGHKNVKGLFAVDAGSTQGVAQVMQKYSLPSQGVHGGGFDLLPVTLQLIQQGVLDFTIDQQPYLQGYYPVLQLFLYKLSGGLMYPSDTDTGLKFLTKDNVAPYMSTKSRFEGSSSDEKNLASA